jgi:single-stranded-DNA-specific exonuclease
LDSLRLLCTKSERQAAELAKLLGKTNQQRQKIVETAMLHAKSVAQDLQTTGFIVVWHDTYHEGVVGLVASKLTEEFGRPAIVFAKGEEISKASARSVPGINIFEVIQEMGSLLLTAGGHEMAAGLSVKTQNLEKFKEKLTKISTKYLDARIFKKTLLVDMEIDFKAITYKLNHALLALNPHGQGNPAPVFVSRAVEISDIKLVGRNSDHLKLKLMHNNKYFDAIGFGMGITTLSGLTKGSKVDVAYSIEENRWNGNFSLQLKLKDIII